MTVVTSSSQKESKSSKKLLEKEEKNNAYKEEKSKSYLPPLGGLGPDGKPVGPGDLPELPPYALEP